MSEVLGRWRATYTPGTWLVLCGPTSAVVLEPADASWSDLVDALWAEVLAAGSIGELAARLAAYRIDTMPSFAAFFWGRDGMRSLVRGAVRVVDADTDEVVVDGDGVQTWTEVGLPALTRVRVDLPTERDPSAYALPLVVGVVTASSLLLDASDAARVTSPQAEPDVADEGLEDLEPYDGGAETQLVDPFADELAEHENASTALFTAPPVLPPEPDAVAENENADTRLIATADLAPPSGYDAGAAVAAGPTVAAVFCAWGHPNPPGAARCRVCQGVVEVQQPRDIAPPVLAVLRASNGSSVAVDRPVLVGRAPSADRSSAADAELLTVSSPSHDISRTHLEVTPAGWELSVTDLHSTNGTVLVTPDGAARQLDPGETVAIALGTAIELADGVSVVVDFPQ